MSLPSPPFVHVDGIHNFRDVGGYPCSSSPVNPDLNGNSAHPTATRSTRRGLVYRCADTGRITPEGKEKMRSLGMETIFDLRSLVEIRARGEEALENVESMGKGQEGVEDGVKTHLVKRMFVPAFPEQDYSPEAIALRYAAYQSGTVEGFTQAYRDILNAAGPAYRTILLHLRDRPDSPFVVHCSAGKDRTGVIIALILSIAGVPDSIIADEYQLTEVGLGPMREEIVAHLLGTSDALKGNRKEAEKMVGAKRAYMANTLVVLKEEYGGAEAYVKKYCGLNDEDVAKIRENITVEAAPIHYRDGVA